MVRYNDDDETDEFTLLKDRSIYCGRHTVSILLVTRVWKWVQCFKSVIAKAVLVQRRKKMSSRLLIYILCSVRLEIHRKCRILFSIGLLVYLFWFGIIIIIPIIFRRLGTVVTVSIGRLSSVTRAFLKGERQY